MISSDRTDERDEKFALFSRSGFVDGLGDDWSLFGLDELDDLL